MKIILTILQILLGLFFAMCAAIGLIFVLFVIKAYFFGTITIT